eukprot:m.449811 g.449811  ORF g.449811 m.449811 type:complete len:137 (-) comp20319_c0_seq24:982-1392(-)
MAEDCAPPSAATAGNTAVAAAFAHLPNADPEALTYVNLKGVQTQYVCAICECPLLEPVQLPCGHMFCAMHFRKGQLAACPSDRQPLPDPGELAPMKSEDHPSTRVILDLLGELQVRCTLHGAEAGGAVFGSDPAAT